jgi:acetolactate synthase-1/2/3 large subunit
LHEIPRQRDVLGSVTKWVGRATTPAGAPGVVREAFRQLQSGRPRPVAVETPPDMLQASEDVTLVEPVTEQRSAGDPEMLKRAAAMLRNAERPVIYSGGGVLLAEAWDELRAVAEMLQAPVIMSTDGRGAISDRSYLAHTGLSGMKIVPEADVVLAVGTRFFQPAVAWGLPPGAQTIRIDIDPQEMIRHGAPTVGIVGDAKRALAGLRDALDGLQRPSRETELRARKEAAQELLDPIQPQVAYYDAIRAALPDDGIVIADLTQVTYVMTLGFPVYEPRTFIGPGYQGTLGSGLSTALGAQVGNPGRKVIAVMGDGGFMYQVEELATMKLYGIKAVAVVFNDNAYGNVRRTQRQMFGGRVIASDLANPDFVALAQAFGISGVRVQTPDGLEGALREALAADEPVLIEVAVGEMPSAWHLVAPAGGGYPVLLPR